MTQAYYRTGAFIVDFEDPANPSMLGWFLADGGANYWSNKPHRGYMFATDMDHGLDILKYTGEGGTRWPATAGPAEVQRSARQGVPYVPIGGAKTTPLPSVPKPASNRVLGKFAFTARAKRVPGKGTQVPRPDLQEQGRQDRPDAQDQAQGRQEGDREGHRRGRRGHLLVDVEVRQEGAHAGQGLGQEGRRPEAVVERHARRAREVATRIAGSASLPAGTLRLTFAPRR